MAQVWFLHLWFIVPGTKDTGTNIRALREFLLREKVSFSIVFQVIKIFL